MHWGGGQAGRQAQQAASALLWESGFEVEHYLNRASRGEGGPSGGGWEKRSVQHGRMTRG